MTGPARRTASILAPWAGWIGGGLGWALSNQIGSDLAHYDCTAAQPMLMGGIGMAGALLASLGGLLSFRHWRAGDGDTARDRAGTRRFLALVSSMAAGIFLLAILFQTLSSFIIPRCHA